ncbi:MAG: flagellar export chaperone FlgN [Gammaproteobacteria bacterium]|nr:flagellar export chaperone FlgN [Gammaproteobacteria bacterium]
MSQADSHDLALIVDRVEQLGAELMAALLAERSALRDRAVDAIVLAAATKQALFDGLADATRRLREHAGDTTSTIGRRRDPATRDRLRTQLETAGLLPQWQQASDRLAQCMLLNQHNGIVVAGQLALQRNLLEIVCGRERDASLYSPLGRIDHLQGGTALARV